MQYREIKKREYRRVNTEKYLIRNFNIYWIGVSYLVGEKDIKVILKKIMKENFSLLMKKPQQIIDSQRIPWMMKNGEEEEKKKKEKKKKRREREKGTKERKYPLFFETEKALKKCPKSSENKYFEKSGS